MNKIQTILLVNKKFNRYLTKNTKCLWLLYLLYLGTLISIVIKEYLILNMGLSENTKSLFYLGPLLLGLMIYKHNEATWIGRIG
jgi:hypothetical protein